MNEFTAMASVGLVTYYFIIYYYLLIILYIITYL